MNIPKIFSSRFARQQAIFWAVAIPLVGAALYNRKFSIGAIQNEINQTKAELYAKAPQKYDLLAARAEKLDLYEQRHFWSRELKDVNDSMYTDSMIIAASQRAYLQGAQMVRDSVANAEK